MLRVVKDSRIISVGGKLVADGVQLSAAVKESSRPMQIWFTKAKAAEELAAAKAKVKKELEAAASTPATPPAPPTVTFAPVEAATATESLSWWTLEHDCALVRAVNAVANRLRVRCCPMCCRSATVAHCLLPLYSHEPLDRSA